KVGFDTLTLTIEQFMLIRPFPLLLIGILVGGLVAVVGGWIYLKKKRGDGISWKRESTPRDREKEAEQRRKESEQRKKDRKSDVKEYFGV
ncbi:MAG: hypothetical protein ACXABX_06460, partial [Candidatus Thorarchaeota archaeon]